MSFFISAIEYCDIRASNVIRCKNAWVPIRNTSNHHFQIYQKCLNPVNYIFVGGTVTVL